jgi:hypothetical protein
MIPPLLLAALIGVTAKYYWQPQYASGAMTGQFEGDIGILVSDPWEYQRDSYFPCNDEKGLSADLFAEYKTLFTCGQSKENAAVDIAIVGDSHAAHLFF